MIVSFYLCSSVVKFKLMRWWGLLMACRYVSFYLSSLSLSSFFYLSLSLPLLLYKLVCLTNSLPSSLCSCSPLFFIFVLYLSSYSSLSFNLPPHFYLCSSAFKFKLIIMMMKLLTTCRCYLDDSAEGTYITLTR